MGDPAGVGPEIVAKLFAAGDVDAFVIGDEAVMRTVGRARGRDASTASRSSRSASRSSGIVPGRVDARAGGAAFDYIKRAVAIAPRGEMRAVVTAPINKEG